MATWTNIGDTFLEPGKPARSVDALALRDNPIAIAEGAPGAPRIANEAVASGALGAEKFQTGTDEGNWVLARTAGASAGSVGSYAMLISSVQPVNFGATIAGNFLAASNGGGTGTGAVSGTWRCMGAVPNVAIGSETATLWLRIA